MAWRARGYGCHCGHGGAREEGGIFREATGGGGKGRDREQEKLTKDPFGLLLDTGAATGRSSTVRLSFGRWRQLRAREHRSAPTRRAIAAVVTIASTSTSFEGFQHPAVHARARPRRSTPWLPHHGPRAMSSMLLGAFLNATPISSSRAPKLHHPPWPRARAPPSAMVAAFEIPAMAI